MSVRRGSILALFASVILSFGFGADRVIAAEEQKQEFVDGFFTKDVPRVWEWREIISSDKTGVSSSLLKRYYRDPKSRPGVRLVGITFQSQEVPELGILLQVWNVRENLDGSYDFANAVYAHKLDNEEWFVAVSGFLITEVNHGYKDIADVVVYRRVVKEHPKFDGVAKIIGEYRVRYSAKILVGIVFKLFDPGPPEKEVYSYWLDLGKTSVGERRIQKKEILK